MNKLKMSYDEFIQSPPGKSAGISSVILIDT